MLRRLIVPHLIVLSLLVLGAGSAAAREGVSLPVSCEVHSDRIVLQPSQPTVYEIITEREREVYSACRPGGPNSCRPILVYRFDVACGAERVPWMEVAAALLSAGGSRAAVRRDRLHIRPRQTPQPRDCDSTDPAFAFMKDCDAWARKRNATPEWVLPSGFAPVHEVGARFVELPPVVEAPKREPEPKPEAPLGTAEAGLEFQAPAPVEPMPPPVIAEATPEPPPVATSPEPPEPAAVPEMPPAEAETAESEAIALARAAIEAADEPAQQAPDVPTTLSTAKPEPQEKSDPHPQVKPAPGSDLRMVSVTGWSSTVNSIDEQIMARPGLQFLSTLEHFVAPLLSALEQMAVRARSLPLEKEFTTVLMGVALLTGLLFSGIGWYSVRTRSRVRAAPAFGLAETQPVHFRPSSPGTFLVPSDEKMCGELCRTAHTMLQQIDARVDELHGVAPLRRVLQREMRNLEQFLTAVMTASPREPEEWRRMRNRLQRIVKELHRLRDIVEGAYRSLSAGGFTSREPPRDKYEAYEALGVNPDVSPRTLKKLVDALRACWHPDLAKDERDRQAREERMKRINIAWDIITSKRQEA